ncbi:MAG: hypothetical protein AAFU85_00240 [Planctomycetota bacterium]
MDAETIKKKLTLSDGDTTPMRRNQRNHPALVIVLLAVTPFVTVAGGVSAQSPQSDQPEAPGTRQETDAASEETAKALAAARPFFDRIKRARSTRATIELTAETIVDGAIVGTQVSTYQIASTAPKSFTVYLKDQTQRTRLFCDGEKATLALSPTAFTHLDQVIGMQEAVFGLPFALGPYPEVVLATTLAGVDPALTLANGMRSLTLMDRGRFRGRTPAIHLRGVQDDDVSWELWLTEGKEPEPLRLQVDLTQMLRANGDLQLPSGYKYLLRFDYAVWKLNLNNGAELYRYRKLADAKEYESIQAYADAERAKNEERAKNADPGR